MTYLQPAIDAALPMLRAEAEARMESQATIRRKTGATVIVDNLEVDEWEIVHTDLPCRVAVAGGGAARSRTQSPGGVEIERSTPGSCAMCQMPSVASTTNQSDITGANTAPTRPVPRF